VRGLLKLRANQPGAAQIYTTFAVRREQPEQRSFRYF